MKNRRSRLLSLLLAVILIITTGVYAYGEESPEFVEEDVGLDECVIDEAASTLSSDDFMKMGITDSYNLMVVNQCQNIYNTYHNTSKRISIQKDGKTVFIKYDRMAFYTGKNGKVVWDGAKKIKDGEFPISVKIYYSDRSLMPESISNDELIKEYGIEEISPEKITVKIQNGKSPTWKLYETSGIGRLYPYGNECTYIKSIKVKGKKGTKEYFVNEVLKAYLKKTNKTIKDNRDVGVYTGTKTAMVINVFPAYIGNAGSDADRKATEDYIRGLGFSIAEAGSAQLAGGTTVKKIPVAGLSNSVYKVPVFKKENLKPSVYNGKKNRYKYNGLNVDNELQKKSYESREYIEALGNYFGRIYVN